MPDEFDGGESGRQIRGHLHAGIPGAVIDDDQLQLQSGVGDAQHVLDAARQRPRFVVTGDDDG
jgi:hypothetical protein